MHVVAVVTRVIDSAVHASRIEGGRGQRRPRRNSERLGGCAVHLEGSRRPISRMGLESHLEAIGESREVLIGGDCVRRRRPASGDNPGDIVSILRERRHRRAGAIIQRARSLPLGVVDR